MCYILTIWPFLIYTSLIFFPFIIFSPILIHAVVNMSDLDIVYYFKGVDL